MRITDVPFETVTVRFQRGVSMAGSSGSPKHPHVKHVGLHFLTGRFAQSLKTEASDLQNLYSD